MDVVFCIVLESIWELIWDIILNDLGPQTLQSEGTTTNIPKRRFGWPGMCIQMVIQFVFLSSDVQDGYVRRHHVIGGDVVVSIFCKVKIQNLAAVAAKKMWCKV